MQKICPNGHTFDKTSNCPTCPICAEQEMNQAYASGFPKIGGPAYRALKTAKISLADLSRYSETELLKLHGLGPKAIGILKAYLARQNQSLKA